MDQPLRLVHYLTQRRVPTPPPQPSPGGGGGALRRGAGRFLCPVAVVLVAALLTACVGRATLHGAIDALYAGDVSAADARLSRYGHRVSNNDALLYLLNAGVVKQMAGEYQESNRLLEAAEGWVERFLTRSVSREAATFLVNDQTRPYQGAAYEQALINYYKALNYLLLGKTNEAVVECRRLDVRLNDLADRAGKAGVFGEEGYLRYFTGLIYEAAGEEADALVAYRNALTLYGRAAPPGVPAAVVRVAGRLGLPDIVAAVASDFPAAAAAAPADAQVVVVVHAGRVPYKVSESLVVPTVHGFPVRLSLPALTGERGGRPSVTVTVGGATDHASLVEDVGAVAHRELDDRRGRDLARLVARAVTKELAAQAARQKGGEAAGLLVRVVNLATEVADTRSWESLPARIYLARLPVSPGVATLDVAVDGRRVARESLEIHDGATIFRKYRVF